MQTNLVVLNQSPQHKERKSLLKTIAKKKRLLFSWTEKYEALELEVSLIQNEYNARIGSLYVRDNVLDAEIIRYKRISSLIGQGLSFEEAEESLKKEVEEATEKIDAEEFIDTVIEDWQSFANASMEKQASIRNLWKKLVRMFHPDLAKNHEERREREKVMKQINTAYKALDYDALKSVEEKQTFEKTEEATIEELGNIVVSLENALFRVRKDYKSLKVSEWFYWLKKTKNEKEKLFKELEEELLSNIVRKEVYLRSLKKKCIES